ncbi:MAG: hypothetical protein IT558_02935 [Alphaproteobacteria bacterium]|nr:hypothetical protein [Alphaproteobacteria bacterium]
MRFLAFIMFVLVSFPALAEEANQETMCRLLPEHRPEVNIAFSPGVDVHGKAVVPADVEGAKPLQNFDTVEIPVEINLLQKFGVDAPAGVELQPYAALISIHKDGRVDYNGQDISQQAYALCKDKKDE